MKGEDLTVLKQTTQLTHKRSYQWLPSESRWKKLPLRLNLLNGSRLYYKTTTCEKKFCFCSVLQGNPAVASPSEQLYEQMTFNPAFTEKYTKMQHLSLFSSGAKIFGHVSHSTELLHMCLACQHFDFNSTDWSPIICMWSPANICEQRKRNLSFSSADVCGAGTRDEPLRRSAWEASFGRKPLVFSKYFRLPIFA